MTSSLYDLGDLFVSRQEPLSRRSAASRSLTPQPNTPEGEASTEGNNRMQELMNDSDDNEPSSLVNSFNLGSITEKDLAERGPPHISCLALGDGPTPALVCGDTLGRVNFLSEDSTFRAVRTTTPNWEAANGASGKKQKLATASLSSSMAASSSPLLPKKKATSARGASSPSPPPQTPPPQQVKALRHRFTHEAFKTEIETRTSVRIDPKVNAVQILPKVSPLSTTYVVANERYLKIFKVRDAEYSQEQGRMGKAVPIHRSMVGPPKLKNLMNTINCLSLCADQQTLLCSDEFGVFWYDLNAEYTTKSVQLVDFRPDGELEYLLTSSRFHPTHGSLFLVASSDGTCHVGDLRDPPCREVRKFSTTFTTTAENNPIQWEDHDDVLCSVSDCAFVGQNHVVTRDLLSMKLWDMRKADAPVEHQRVMDCVIPHLDDLYETDAIFKRFKLDVDPLTGTVFTTLFGCAVMSWRPLNGGAVEIYQGSMDAAPLPGSSSFSGAGGNVTPPPAAAARKGGASPQPELGASGSGSGSSPFVRCLEDGLKYPTTEEGQQAFVENMVDHVAVSSEGAHRMAFACREKVFMAKLR